MICWGWEECNNCKIRKLIVSGLSDKFCDIQEIPAAGVVGVSGFVVGVKGKVGSKVVIEDNGKSVDGRNVWIQTFKPWSKHSVEDGHAFF